MYSYEDQARRELFLWQTSIGKKASLLSQLSEGIQDRINRFIPEKAHQVITEAIKQMGKAVLFGSEFISGEPLTGLSLEEREFKVREKVATYKKVAAASGFGTGAAGFLLSLADFPILLTLKMKLLFDLALIYGYSVRDYPERLYILHIFQVAFASADTRPVIYQRMLHWEDYRKELPDHINDFDWRTFQQEYRDFIDLAKLLQMVPGLGAVVGAYANHQLVDKLGNTAMNAYRMRTFNIRQIDARQR